MDETRFHTLADATLAQFLDRLEPLFDSGALEELDLQGGILTIVSGLGTTFLVTKHAPTRQLWLASPLSGGLHFPFNEETGGWHLPDGTALDTALTRELASQNITVAL